MGAKWGKQKKIIAGLKRYYRKWVLVLYTVDLEFDPQPHWEGFLNRVI